MYTIEFTENAPARPGHSGWENSVKTVKQKDLVNEPVNLLFLNLLDTILVLIFNYLSDILDN